MCCASLNQSTDRAAPPTGKPYHRPRNCANAWHGLPLLALLFEAEQKLSREGFHRALGELRVDARKMHAEYEMRRPPPMSELLQALRDILGVAHDRSEQQR